MNMLCVRVLPFNWPPTQDMWYVGIEGDSPDEKMCEFDIWRPVRLFTMDFRIVSKDRKCMKWLIDHCKARRSNRP